MKEADFFFTDKKYKDASFLYKDAGELFLADEMLEESLKCFQKRAECEIHQNNFTEAGNMYLKMIKEITKTQNKLLVHLLGLRTVVFDYFRYSFLCFTISKDDEKLKSVLTHNYITQDQKQKLIAFDPYMFFFKRNSIGDFLLKKIYFLQ